MSDNKNEVVEMGKGMFSLFSLKTKLIILSVIIVIFLIIIVPVVVISSLFTTDDKQSSTKNGGDSSTTTTATEIVPLNGMKQYTGAVFPMPFESWDSSTDVVTSLFSPSRTITVNGVTKTSAHTGIDLVVTSVSEPKICAVLAGTVVTAKAGTTGYGNYVAIKHETEDGITFYTLYGHMKAGSIMVAEGSEVEQGQVLGIMGSTGNSTGEHLHFEIRLTKNSSSNAVDPYTYLFGS